MLWICNSWFSASYKYKITKNVCSRAGNSIYGSSPKASHSYRIANSEVITLFSCSILISPMSAMFTFHTLRKGRIKTSIDISNREVKGLWGQRGMTVIISTGYQNMALAVALKEHSCKRSVCIVENWVVKTKRINRQTQEICTLLREE